MPVLTYPHIVYLADFYSPMFENGIHHGNECTFWTSFDCASFRQRGVYSQTILTDGCTLLVLGKYFDTSNNCNHFRTCDVVNYEEDIDPADLVEEEECIAQDVYLRVIGFKTGMRQVIYNEAEDCEVVTKRIVSLDIDFTALEFQFLIKPTPSKFRSF